MGGVESESNVLLALNFSSLNKNELKGKHFYHARV